MIKSMTGYGKAEVVTERGRIVVEVRSVNHRYGEITVKLPRGLAAVENDLRKRVSERLKRGKIDVYVQREEADSAREVPTVDLPLARAYLEALRTLKDELGLAGEVTLPLLAGQRDILGVKEAPEDEESLRGDLLEGVGRAVEVHEAMRLREGAALLEDILDRRGAVSRLLEEIRRRAPRVVEEHAARLKERVARLLGETAPDEARLAQEIALLADRGDITEELVRFASHLQQFDEALTSGEPVGRKLDFLLQEMNRETNTIGSKANDAAIAAGVVDLKAELEKIREQVQNVE